MARSLLMSYTMRMATDKSFIAFLTDQIALPGRISSRKMFGEYALYCDEKVVALVCGNQLYIKPTDPGRAYIGTPTETPAYPGGKPWFLIEDQYEDSDWLTELVEITARALPLPKPKIKKPRKPETI